ncbi:MAG: gamma-butyrobetaine hydroxylase-like domain-containing protein [Bradyrhizobium sp.]
MVSAPAQVRPAAPWPVEIRLVKDRRALHVTFDDGAAFNLSAELLRVTSPSAEVQGHSEVQRKTVGGKRNVTILSVDPVGNYAVRLGFDDMHTTGIYSWAFLRDLGANAERRFADYLDELQAKALDRDRPGMR